MRITTPKIVAAVAAVAALAAGGAAFTASTTLPGETTAGYNSMSVSGEQVDSIHYDLSADGTKILKVNLVFQKSVLGKTVEASFGDGTSALSPCVVQAAPDDKKADCAFTQDTQTADDLHVAVHDA